METELFRITGPPIQYVHFNAIGVDEATIVEAFNNHHFTETVDPNALNLRLEEGQYTLSIDGQDNNYKQFEKK